MSYAIYNLKAEIFDKRGKKISEGRNWYHKSHPVQAKYAKMVGRDEAIYLHAEIHAILKCKNLEDAHRIVVSRYDSQGNPRLAKPCPICKAAIEDVGIEVIEHT